MLECYKDTTWNVTIPLYGLIYCILIFFFLANLKKNLGFKWALLAKMVIQVQYSSFGTLYEYSSVNLLYIFLGIPAINPPYVVRKII